MRDWDISIYRGVLTGYNEAFIIDSKKKDELIAEDPKSVEIIRPILRGRDIKRYSYEFADKWLICATRDIVNTDIPNKYPAICKHLEQYKGKGKLGDNSTTKVFKRPWWSLMQEPTGYWDDFSKQKIVWADLARTGNAFTYDNSNSLVLNTCYILTLPEENDEKLMFILAVLNSKLVLFYMDLISSKLDETGWRWFKQFVELLPIPLNENNLSKIAYLVRLLINEKNRQKTEDLEKEINNLTYKLFELSLEEIEFIESQYSSMNSISS